MIHYHQKFDTLPPEIKGAAAEETFSNILTRDGKLVSLMDLISPVLTGKQKKIEQEKNFTEEDDIGLRPIRSEAEKISDAIKLL